MQLSILRYEISVAYIMTAMGWNIKGTVMSRKKLYEAMSISA